ncbi:DUF1878 family protein [Sediminibacillus massiliensis]|uniref:DUF1878 family protein n=1 Tax=Sediminibacillus massiliensis TaxID=1926277 RepID=UPI0009885AE4|nr:DUF1878 family protein [Sediminibacillus massiliensis]
MGSKEHDDVSLFHIHLLLKLKEIEEYPFTKLVIEKELTKEEYQEIIKLVNAINEEYLMQKEEGLLDVTPLLLHFVGMLNHKLEPEQTIYALKKEGYYPSLMSEFLNLPVFKG